MAYFYVSGMEGDGYGHDPGPCNAPCTSPLHLSPPGCTHDFQSQNLCPLRQNLHFSCSHELCHGVQHAGMAGGRNTDMLDSAHDRNELHLEWLCANVGHHGIPAKELLVSQRCTTTI